MYQTNERRLRRKTEKKPARTCGRAILCIVSCFCVGRVCPVGRARTLDETRCCRIARSKALGAFDNSSTQKRPSANGQAGDENNEIAKRVGMHPNSEHVHARVQAPRNPQPRLTCTRGTLCVVHPVKMTYREHNMISNPTTTYRAPTQRSQNTSLNKDQAKRPGRV